MGFNFDAAAARRGKKGKAKAAPKTVDAPQELTSDEESYRERAKAEQKRRDLATDASTFTCFCFRSRAELERFVSVSALNLVNGRYTFDEDFRAALDRAGFEAPKMAYRQPMRPSVERMANPCAGVEMTGDPERDIESQFMALFCAMRDRKDREEYQHPLDSPYYVCVIFRSMADRDSMLRRYGFTKWGFQYVDGSAAFKKILA